MNKSPEEIAPKLWNAYKDKLNNEALYALRNLICGSEEYHERISFVDIEDVARSFFWDETLEGREFWNSVDDGEYDKPIEEYVPPACPNEEGFVELIINSVPKEIAELTEDDLIDIEHNAASILEEAMECLYQRAKERDKEDGERSMKSCVEAFNALTKHELTEEQGWLFVAVLKMARSQGGCYKMDDFVDGAAYMALAGEAGYKSSLKESN